MVGERVGGQTGGTKMGNINMRTSNKMKVNMVYTGKKVNLTRYNGK